MSLEPVKVLEIDGKKFRITKMLATNGSEHHYAVWDEGNKKIAGCFASVTAEQDSASMKQDLISVIYDCLEMIVKQTLSASK